MPLLNEAFDTEPLSLGQWLVCAGLSSAVLVVGELLKAGLRRWGRPRRA